MMGAIDAKPGSYTISPSGLIIPKKLRPVAVDLFCGAGGMSLGIKQAGFHVVAAMDSDAAAAMTYTVNLGAHPMKFHFATPEDEDRLEDMLSRHLKEDTREGIKVACTSGSGWISHHPEIEGCKHFFFGDIRKFTGEQILSAIGLQKGEVDLVSGGPPCQGFSHAGRRDVMDPRNSLVFEFARLILEIEPKTIVMENVPGIVNMVTPEGIPVVDAFCRILEDGGFGTLDGLKCSLTHTTGAGGALRRKRRKEGKQEENLADENKQLELFE